MTRADSNPKKEAIKAARRRKLGGTSSARLRKAMGAFVTYCILIIVCFVFFFPCLWLILSSFSATGSLYDTRGFFPSSYSLNAFITLFTDTALYNYPRWLLNTFIIALCSCILSTILVIGTAYVMSHFEFKARKPLMKTTLVLSMFPSFMGMTAVYLLMAEFGMLNSIWSLVLMYSCTAPLGYLTQKGFFDTIPASIYEAAKVDGATEAHIFRTITLPLSKPMIVYTALSSFTWPWSDYILPSMLLSTRDNWTVAVGLMQLGQDQFSRYAAGSVLIAVPIVIMYFVLAKNMVSGLTSGSVKG